MVPDSTHIFCFTAALLTISIRGHRGWTQWWRSRWGARWARERPSSTRRRAPRSRATPWSSRDPCRDSATAAPSASSWTPAISWQNVAVAPWINTWTPVELLGQQTECQRSTDNSAWTFCLSTRMWHWCSNKFILRRTEQTVNLWWQRHQWISLFDEHLLCRRTTVQQWLHVYAGWHFPAYAVHRGVERKISQECTRQRKAYLTTMSIAYFVHLISCQILHFIHACPRSDVKLCHFASLCWRPNVIVKSFALSERYITTTNCKCLFYSLNYNMP